MQTFDRARIEAFATRIAAEIDAPANHRTHLVREWLPALTGVVAKLTRGARVADVGCGHGASTILMARAFPGSAFTGFDAHRESIAAARTRARDAGVADRVRFEVADAAGYAGSGYALVAFLGGLHDLADPLGAARHARAALAGGGSCMIVQPFAGGRIDGSPAQHARLRDVLLAAGFGSVRRAAETPRNRVLEARARPAATSCSCIRCARSRRAGAIEAWEQRAAELAPAFAAMSGLLSKVWLADPETGTYGGAYLWHGRDALEGYLGGPVLGALAEVPGVHSIEARAFCALDAATRTSGGPLASR